MSNWKKIGEAPSTNRTKTYDIGQNQNTGRLSCSCPAWRFPKNGGTSRDCKHIREFRRTNELPEIDKRCTGIYRPDPDLGW